MDESFRTGTDIRDIPILTPLCVVCMKSSTVYVSGEEWNALRKPNRDVASIFPGMNADDREVFISGTHPECWDQLFGDEE